jgi:hypothetical protein
VPRAAQARNQHHLRREAPCAQVGSPNPGSTKPAVEHLDRTLRRNPRAARSGRPSGAGNLRGPPSGPKPSPLQARISATPSYIDAAKSPITSQRSASCSPQNQRPTSPGLPRTGGEKSARGAFGSPRQPPAQPGRPSAWPTPSRNASPPGLTRSANRARTQPLVSALAAQARARCTRPLSNSAEGPTLPSAEPSSSSKLPPQPSERARVGARLDHPARPTRPRLQ